MKLFKVPARALAFIVLACALAACSATKDARRVPAPLVDFTPALQVAQVWKASVGKAGRYLFHPAVAGDAVYAAGENGHVYKFDARTGHLDWDTRVAPKLSAGVGTDGTLTAVGGIDGKVFVLGADGKKAWEGNVDGEILTPPLIGHGVVLVRTADGRITAFNSANGEQKWVYRNRAVPLNLRTTVGMTFGGATGVLAGFPGGSLAALNLENGEIYWQTPVSFPSGVTEVERINDVAGAPTLVGRETCAVTFQGQIGCFDGENGQPIWLKPFSSYGGLVADDKAVIAADDWSVITAYAPLTGDVLWRNDQLKSRDVSRPVLAGNAVVVGDYKGFVHFLSRDDGHFVAREKTDNSAIGAPPVLAGQTLIVQTRDGGLFGFRPK